MNGLFSNGGPNVEERIARGKEARKRFLETGIVDYTPVVDAGRKDVGLPYKEIYDWYHKWENISAWENRYTTMSDAEVWTFNINEYTKQLSVPTCIIHGERSDGGPKAAQHVYDDIKCDKKLTILPNVFHTRFYDDPIIVDVAVDNAVFWLKEKLMTKYPASC